MYIARNRDGELSIFEEKPVKTAYVWVSDKSAWDILSDDSKFPEVRWEDDEPRKLVLNSLEEKESCEDNRKPLHCNNCGGTSILKHAWVDANTLEFAQEDWANNEYWCEDCMEIVDIAEEEETNEGDKDIC